MLNPSWPICKVWVRRICCMSTFKTNSLLIDSWKCKMPDKCLIIWTLGALEGKGTADGRGREGAVGLMRTVTPAGRPSLQIWLSCCHWSRRTCSQKPAPVTVLGGDHGVTVILQLSVSLQGHKIRKPWETCSTHKKLFFSQAPQFSAKGSKVLRAANSTPELVCEDLGMMRGFPEFVSVGDSTLL